jgi:hypothetical protein
VQFAPHYTYIRMMIEKWMKGMGRAFEGLNYGYYRPVPQPGAASRQEHPNL